jgi:choline-glycine betaine transporter
MIGQFTAKFVGGMRTWQLFIHMLVWPSLSIAIWFSVLYVFYSKGISVSSAINTAMVGVGVIFVINSLDSLLRVYTDNLSLTPKRLGQARYICLQFCILAGLVTLFKLDFLKIQWIGALVIGLICLCAAYTTRVIWQNRALVKAD